MGTTDAESTSAAVETQLVPGRDRTTTIRLPLISVTFTRPARPEGQERPPDSGTASSTGEVPAAGSPLADEAASVGGVSLPRAAFYAGAVALGALEVVEWPVTLLVVAGTYVADQVRGPAAPAATPGGSGSSSAPAGPVLPASAPPLHAGA